MLRVRDRAWYQANADRVKAQRKARRAAKRKNAPAKPPKLPPDPEVRRAKQRAKGAKRRLSPAYRAAADLRSKAWRDGNPERMRALNKIAKTRVVVEQEMLAGRPRPQACDICDQPGRRIHFDHCHQSGQFRGWICGQCNLALGLVRDDITVLRKMVAYLEHNAS